MAFEIIMLIDAVAGESRQAQTNSMELRFCPSPPIAPTPLYQNSNYLQPLIYRNEFARIRGWGGGEGA